MRMIGLYLSALLVVGFIAAEGVMLFVPKVTEAEPEIRTIAVVDETLPPILSRIAECESGNTHYGKSGQVLAIGNKNGSVDVGRYQINISTWGAKATELGYDLWNEGDNEKMAVWIYENHGTEPWHLTRDCWL